MSKICFEIQIRRLEGTEEVKKGATLASYLLLTKTAGSQTGKSNILELLDSPYRLRENEQEEEQDKQVIMKAKAPIKIIKRGERTRQDKSANSPATVRKSAQETARDIVSTVSGWVNELQQKRRTETARAIKVLIAETTPQTSKA